MLSWAEYRHSSALHIEKKKRSKVDAAVVTWVSFYSTVSVLTPPQALRFQSQAGELEVRETGDEHAKDQGKEKEERRYAVSLSFPFPSSLARPPLSQRERRLGTRQLLGCSFLDLFLTFLRIFKTYSPPLWAQILLVLLGICEHTGLDARVNFLCHRLHLISPRLLYGQ